MPKLKHLKQILHLLHTHTQHYTTHTNVQAYWDSDSRLHLCFPRTIWVQMALLSSLRCNYFLYHMIKGHILYELFNVKLFNTMGGPLTKALDSEYSNPLHWGSLAGLKWKPLLNWAPVHYILHSLNTMTDSQSGLRWPASGLAVFQTDLSAALRGTSTWLPPYLWATLWGWHSGWLTLP